MAGVRTLGSGRPSAFWSGYLRLVCFSDGESPEQICGLPAGVSGHGQSGLALFCFMWKPHCWGHSWGAGALFSSWLPSVAQAGGPMSEPPVPWEGRMSVGGPGLGAGSGPQCTLAWGHGSEDAGPRGPVLEKASVTEGKGQGSDEVQAQVLGRPQEDPSSKTLDKRPPQGITTLCFLLSPRPPRPCLAGLLLCGVRCKDGEPWPGGRQQGAAIQPTAHPLPSCARPPGGGPQCSFVWQLAQSTGRVFGAALAGRRCQPWRPEMPGWGGRMRPAQSSGPRATCCPENTWAGLAASQDSWDPGGLCPGSGQPQQRPGCPSPN